MKRLTNLLLVAALGLLCPVAGRAADAKELEAKLEKETIETIGVFKQTDTEMEKLFKESAGYVVFPVVGKGAAGIGAAYGEGKVFEKGKPIGTATLTQVTIGLQLGGQKYAEVIFFETKEALAEFKAGQFAISAQVSAVAAAEGAAANAKYQLGVMVFTLARGGLMYEASVGGQKFKFTPAPKPGAS